MLKIGQNWGKIANYPPQCSTKIGITGYYELTRPQNRFLQITSPAFSLTPRFQPDGLVYQMKCYGVENPFRYLHYGCWCGPSHPRASKGGYNSIAEPLDQLDRQVIDNVN